MNSITFTYLNFIDLQDFSTWDVKRYLSTSINSHFPIEKLGKHIKEENNKIFPKKQPDIDFEILGVNNKTGIFDAYIRKGKDIKQPYKVVENGFLAYNPYRINVGSIGLKLPEHKHNYISPAYVVFSCTKNLLPEFLFLMFKTDRFNQIIKDSTTGSVRQNLSFTNLCRIEIPLPPIHVQEKLIEEYNSKILFAEQLENEAENLENYIETYLLEELGIEIAKKKKFEVAKLNFVDFKALNQWGISINRLSITAENIFESYKYPNKPINQFFYINPTTYIPNNEYISFIPMASVSDEYGEVLEKEDRIISSGYTRFKEDDLIWARITPCMENGKSAIAKNLKNGFGFGSTEFHVLRSKSEKFNIALLHLLLRTNYLRQTAKNYFTGSAGQQRVPKSFLEELNLPYIDDISIQNKIVSNIEKFRQSQKQKALKAETLRKEILVSFENAIFN